MKIRNPAWLAALKPAVQTAITAAGAQAEYLTFDAIRAGCPESQRAQLTDAVLRAICADLGHAVITPSPIDNVPGLTVAAP